MGKGKKKLKKLGKAATKAKKLDLAENIRICKSQIQYQNHILDDFVRLESEARAKLNKAQAEYDKLLEDKAQAPDRLVGFGKKLEELRQTAQRIIFAPKLSKLEKLRKQIAELEGRDESIFNPNPQEIKQNAQP